MTSAGIDVIKKNSESFAQAVNTKSSDLGNGYADDVISMPPHNTSKVGKEKTVEVHSAPEPKVSSFVVNSEGIEGTGDLACSRGTFASKAVLNDSVEINDNGKYFVVFKKAGRWFLEGHPRNLEFLWHTKRKKFSLNNLKKLRLSQRSIIKKEHHNRRVRLTPFFIPT